MNPNYTINKKNLIAANWKMNVLPSEALALAIAITDIEWPDYMELVIFPPYTHLSGLQSIRKDGVKLGAQNCHENNRGAFTGEVSVDMLVDLQCDYVIIGHSERRAINPNENDRIYSKLKTAIQAGLHVIYCCGESKDVREQGNEMNFISNQLQSDLFNLDAADFNYVTIAYEPIWAIGTGNHASPEQAQSMHSFIRTNLTKHIGDAIANEVRILYDGSVNASNVKSFALQKDIDGVLVGGASLIPEEFKHIIKAFSNQFLY
jgi:triosephosphate isomerase